MSGEETILDAPVTPAPVFAYRALRGIFFGSPETPVISTDRTSSNGDNKENEGSGKPLYKTVTQPRARSSPLQKRESSNSATNVMLSPTKSCLRTPGAVTPRRGLLRDINVTFKDIRGSASPEMQRKNTTRAQSHSNFTINEQATTQPRSNPQLPTNGAKPGRPSSSSATTTARASTASVKPTHNIPLSPSPPQPAPVTIPVSTDSSTFMQTYMGTTEKEMKKLIRYSQRMREYARKQDEDNTKLKQLVEELQQENARLKRKADAMESDDTQRHENREPHVDADTKRRRILEPQPESHNESHPQLNRSTTLGTLKGTRLNSLNISTSLARSTHQATKTNRKPHLPDVYRSDENPAEMNIPLRPSSQMLHINNISNPNGLGTNVINPNVVAPDRLAAARARIRQRSEMRKGSVNATRGILQPRNSTRELIESIGKRRDQKSDSSMLDWAGL